MRAFTSYRWMTPYRWVGRGAAALLLALIWVGPISAVQASPGETWTGTLSISEQISRQSTDSSYDKTHITTFSLSGIDGFDDDPYQQPLAGWSTTYEEQVSQGGRCPSGTTTIGEASGTDGQLVISVLSESSIQIEVADYGAPGTFPAESTSSSCQDEEGPSSVSAASTVEISHQSFVVESSEGLQEDDLSGTLIRPVTDGTVTYEWELSRGQNPSDGDDQISGTAEADVIETFSGNDVVSAGKGDDKVYGGTGDDLAEGQGGNDLLVGGDNGDVLEGGDGADVIIGDGVNGITHDEPAPSYTTFTHESVTPGADSLFGGGGRDRLTGGAGVDRFNGGPGRDTCIVDSRREKRRARGCEEITLRRSR